MKASEPAKRSQAIRSVCTSPQHCNIPQLLLCISKAFLTSAHDS